MKRFPMILFLLAMVFLACTPAVESKPDKGDTEEPASTDPGVETPVPDPEPPVTFTIKNSAWETVPLNVAARRLSVRSNASAEDYAAAVAAYNASHTDDQLFLYEGQDPAITEAPDANAYMTNPMTNAVLESFENVPRTDLQERRDSWRLQRELTALHYNVRDENGYLVPCALYVDNVPPEEIVTPLPPEPTPYEKYAIYVIDENGEIVNEEHATSETFADRLYAWNLTVELHNTIDDPLHPWSVHSGSLYNPEA